MKDFFNAIKSHVLEEQGPEQQRRAEICAECPLKEKKIYAQIFNAKMQEIDGYVCTECGCPIATKIFAEEPKNICPEWRQKNLQ